MYKPHTYCRACNYGRVAPGTKSPTGEKLRSVFNLGLQPLANDFCKEDEERAGFAPLEVLLCPRCFLGQLSVTVDPAVLYGHYLYVTSPSQTMQEHFQHLLGVLPLKSSPAKVLEIGSNDGAFLKFLQSKGHRVLGVDPALNQVRKADAVGVPTSCGFFSSALVKDDGFVREFRPDFIFARHVFCHVDDWRDFMLALSMLAGDETQILIEVPYVMDLLHRGEFDTIYHEHTSYLSIQSIEALLFSTPLRLHKIERLSIHGGALLLTIVKKGYQPDQDKSVLQELAVEQCGQKEWEHFAVSAAAKIDAVRNFVRKARAMGKRVVGYGASAKSTVWINACGFTRKDLDYVEDATPEKLFRFIPGSDIPIAPDRTLNADCPDYAICFAWNYLREIIQKEKTFLQNGGQWIIPHPEMAVINSGNVAEWTCPETACGCKADPA